MFNFLKKKIDAFTEKVKEKLEKKEELIVKEKQPQAEEPKEEILETLKEGKKKELEERLEEEKISIPQKEKELEKDLTKEELEVLAEIKEDKTRKELEKKAETPKEKKEAIQEFAEEKQREIKEKTEKEILEEKKEPVFEEQFEEKLEKEVQEEKFGKETKEKKIEIKEELEREIPEKTQKIEFNLLKERKLKAKVSLTSKVKKLFTGKIKIEEKDIKDFLEEFELALMEADVEQETSSRIAKGIKEELVGKEIKGENITEILKKEIALSLEKLMQIEKIELEQKMAEKKPFVILFLGPNGAGKTTSIAKIAFKFKKKGKQVILAAADTFRAASIEQIEKHSERIGIRVIKHQYGSDPAAVAFDAVKAAEAKNADLVLIDSAGRQETNVNLMNELKKIDRVTKPDLKLFVGEAMAGNSLFEQAKEFNEKIGFDGFILTKIDTDTKGGTAISLISALKKPVVFVGTGQGYENLVEFTPKFITDRIIK